LLRDGDLPLIPEIVALNALAKFVNEVAQPVADVSAVQPSKAAWPSPGCCTQGGTNASMEKWYEHSFHRQRRSMPTSTTQ
jgi:hypothetical protein